MIYEPLKVPLHSNVRWGSAHGMLEHSYHLRQVSHYYIVLNSCWLEFKAINLFLASANALFGLITTVHTNGQIVKKIPWTAFWMCRLDWERVKDVKDILTVSWHMTFSPVTRSVCIARILRIFNIIFHQRHLPMLWHALPAIKELQTAWEARRDDSHFIEYRDTITDGLQKLPG